MNDNPRHPMDVLDEASRRALVSVVVVGIDEAGEIVRMTSEHPEQAAALSKLAAYKFDTEYVALTYRQGMN